MKTIPYAHSLLLEYLGEYTYLTNSLIMKLGGVRKSKSNLPKVHKSLIDSQLTGRLTFGIHPQYGRLESLFYLKKGGINLLEKMDVTTIKAPSKNDPVFYRDYQHRVATIRFEVEFKKALKEKGFSTKFFHRYFDYQGSTKKKNLKPSTEICLSTGNKIQPDGVCVFNAPRPFIFLLEVSLGTEVKRIVEQNIQHCIAIQEQSANNAFSVSRSAFVVSVFENEQTMKSVMHSMHQIQELRMYENHFLFKTLAQMRNKFWTDWALFTGEKKDFISL